MIDGFIRKNKAACISGLVTFLLIVTLFVLRGLVSQEVTAVKTTRLDLQKTTSEIATQQDALQELTDDLADKLAENNGKMETVVSLTDEIRELD